MVRRYSNRPTYLIGLLITLISLAACAGETSQSKVNIPVPEIVNWIHSDVDVISALSEEPRECLPPISDTQTTLGRLAFRSPFLLGGQAARRGLTCQACHSQGQVNTHFFVVGLSDAPGTADVTSFHFSDVLGDEIFNPVPIPSLSDDIEGVDYTPETKALEAFVRRLITKEFTGPEPTADVESALLAYLRALDNQHCKSPSIKGRENLDFKLKIISSSLEAIAEETLTPESRDFMLAALRIELGRLHNRFPHTPELRENLVEMSADLNTAKVENPNLTQIATEWEILRPNLRQAYEQSLYNTATISEWIDTR